MSSYAIREKTGTYFLTSTIVGWLDVFTRQSYRDFILESFQYCIANKHLHLHAYVIMSNHLHWIISSDEGFALDEIVRDFKKHTSKKLVMLIQSNEQESRREWMLNMFRFAGRTHNDNKENKVWQSGNHPEHLYTDKFVEQKLNYIHLNPVRAGWVEKPEDYLYSSAKNYLGMKGLIVVEPLIVKKFVS